MFSIRNSGIKWFNGILPDERVGIYVQNKSDKITLGFKKEFKGELVSDIKREYSIDKFKKEIKINVTDEVYTVSFLFGYFFRTKSIVYISVTPEIDEWKRMSGYLSLILFFIFFIFFQVNNRAKNK